MGKPNSEIKKKIKNYTDHCGRLGAVAKAGGRKNWLKPSPVVPWFKKTQKKIGRNTSEQTGGGSKGAIKHGIRDPTGYGDSQTGVPPYHQTWGYPPKNRSYA